MISESHREVLSQNLVLRKITRWRVGLKLEVTSTEIISPTR